MYQAMLFEQLKTFLFVGTPAPRSGGCIVKVMYLITTILSMQPPL